MLTFDEFLKQFKEEVDGVYASTEMSDNAKAAVEDAMRDHFGNSKCDPIELLNLFHRICTIAMNREEEDYSLTAKDVEREAAHYLSSETESPFTTMDDDYDYTQANKRKA